MNGDTGHVSKKVKEERNSRVRSAFEEGAGQKVVIDCSFDDLMTEKELCSFRHQLRCTCTPWSLLLVLANVVADVHVQTGRTSEWIVRRRSS